MTMTITMMMNKLGITRTIVKETYALFATDSHVASTLPGWSNCRAIVQISAALGARFSQYLITLNDGGRGEGETTDSSWFLFVVDGTVTLNGRTLDKGGFAYIPPSERYRVEATASASEAPATPATLLVFRKQYEPLATYEPPAFFAGHERDVAERPFLGDPHARLKVLIPDTMQADMAINIFTYDPGATLPFVESHVMEHGMMFLEGGGVYRLDADWHPVTAGDAIWIAAYCPQWFIAAGPGPARYIYYKDVNRLPE
jgi:(S)-ureidoglycine aminohydrolase